MLNYRSSPGMDFRRQEAGGTHVLKRGIDLGRNVSRAMRLNTIPLLNWALYPETLVLIHTSFLLPPL
jgi:hypothetical protein